MGFVVPLYFFLAYIRIQMRYNSVHFIYIGNWSYIARVLWSAANLLHTKTTQVHIGHFISA